MLEKELEESGLIDLTEVGVNASQDTLDQFKTLDSSVSLFKKARSSGHKIDIEIKENFINRSVMPIDCFRVDGM